MEFIKQFFSEIQIIPQIIGILLIITSIIKPHMKTQAGILGIHVTQNVLFSLQYAFLGMWSGVIAGINSVVRGLVFLIYKKKDREIPLGVFLFFLCLLFASVLFVYSQPMDLIPLISVFTVYGYWQNNIKITRWCLLVVGVCYIAYGIITGAYTGALFELIGVISVIVALVKINKPSN